MIWAYIEPYILAHKSLDFSKISISQYNPNKYTILNKNIVWHLEKPIIKSDCVTYEKESMRLTSGA